jgi:ribosome-associated protein
MVRRDSQSNKTTKATSAKAAAPGRIVPAKLGAPEDLVRAAELLAERKANDLMLLDLRGISNATDYFLLASGTSDLHARSVAEHVIEELKKLGSRPDHVEGLRSGRWVLIDYIDFVVHVFHPAAREFYQLERLWGDAPAHTLEA